MGRVIVVVLSAILFLCGHRVEASERVVIDATKAAQLKRLEPLTSDKLAVFVEAGQLTKAQAELVRKHIGRDGRLNLPPDAIGREAAAPVVEAPRRVRDSGQDEDRRHLQKLIQEYRYGDRAEIGRELRKARPAVNELIAASYPDSIDMHIKFALWEEPTRTVFSTGAAFTSLESASPAGDAA